MSDRDAFLRAIADRQGDPLARQQYADWLEDEGRDPVGGCFQRVLAEPGRDDLRLAWADMVGGERGEFVKVQCKVAQIEDADGRPTAGWGELIERLHRKHCRAAATAAAVRFRNAIRRRERRLLTGRAWQWAGKAVRDVYVAGTAWNEALTFTRGFVSTVTLSWADWQTHAAALLAACPLRGVRRERACEHCKGTGHPRGYRTMPVPNCGICRGTGRVAAWVGGGRVVLTTWPEVEHHDRDPGFPGWFVPRRGQYHVERYYDTREDAVNALLAAEWPGVEFVLPAARGVTVDFSALTGAADVPARVLRPGVVFGFGGRP